MELAMKTKLASALFAIVFAIVSCPSLSYAGDGDLVEGEFEVLYNQGGAAIYDKANSNMIYPLRASSVIDQTSLAMLQELHLRIQHTVAKNVTVIVRGRKAPGRIGGSNILVEKLTVKAPWVNPWKPDYVLEVIYWQGALRVIMGGNYFPVVASNRASQSTVNDVDAIERKVRANGGGSRMFAKLDGILQRSMANQQVMFVTAIELANDNEARAVGYEPTGTASDVLMSSSGDCERKFLGF
jgi:hypothetical protein